MYTIMLAYTITTTTFTTDDNTTKKGGNFAEVMISSECRRRGNAAYALKQGTCNN